MQMDMKGMANPKEKTQPGIHKTTAVVKAVDADNGKVTLAHGAIASLNWPPMTMAFSVKDKRLLDKLVVGSTVNVELVKEGPGFMVTPSNSFLEKMPVRGSFSMGMQCPLACFTHGDFWRARHTLSRSQAFAEISQACCYCAG